MRAKQGLGGGHGAVVVQEEEQDKWVDDSSVDHRGRPPLRSATGSWKAAFFIILIEFSERLSYFGIATSLMLYLTKVLQQDMKTAAENANYWMSVTTLMPLLGGFLADAYLGRFSTVLFSTLVYLMGLAILAASQLAPALKPTTAAGSSLRRHEALFFVGIYLVSVGTGGHKPALESFGADQFDDGHPGERRQKMSYFNWWNCALCSGVLLGVTAVVYVQERLGWGAADLLLAAVMAASLVVYLAGYRSYRFRVPDGSPLSPLLRVAVAAVLKRRLPLPADAADLHHEDLGGRKKKKRMLCHTEQFRFLDKAAVVDGGAGKKWLATVTEVEETKLVLAMVPIWLATLAFGVTAAQVSTFFIKQGSAMDRRLGPRFEIPPASIFALAAVGMILAVAAYDKLLEPYARARRGAAAERGISILQRIGVGMGFGILAMAVAAAVERRRLRHSPSPSSMPVLWLVPQFVLMGVGDGFALVGLQEYFYEQVPDSMRSLGIGLYLSVIGAGSFLSGLIIAAADRVTSRGGGQGWFGKDLAHSRLDLFYWLLAVIGAINLGFYVLVATRYSYKQTVAKAAAASSARVGQDIECATLASEAT